MPQTVMDLLGNQAIEAIRRPVETAGGLPGRAYTSQEFFELEQEQFFPRTWMGVAFAGDIPDTGAAQPVMVGKLPVILVRNTQGEIRGFHNVCRHRASMVLTEPCRGAKHLTCPYHAWAWDLDGKLEATPYFDGSPDSRDAALDRENLGLVPVRVAVWHHWVFVNLDGNAPPFAEHVQALVDILGGADIATTRLAKREEWQFKANWKLQNDNWETYHHVWVHKGIFTKLSNDLDLETGELWMEPVQGKHMVSLRHRAGAPNWRGPSNLPDIPLRGGEARMTGTSIIFPNVTMTLTANHIASVITLPLAPNLTIARMGFFFVGDAATDPAYAADRERVLDGWLGKSRQPDGLDGIRSQDMHIWEVQQIARQSPVADDVRVSPVWEKNI
ncbi:MAG: aromatic ring-hydroxylating dioxygenase subunit alpha, partial [Proteobacteria bacterium]|nr:aromatic ring-hydroxylating dioxygenase subunit alpha [Pseudomonadota bacterium]